MHPLGQQACRIGAVTQDPHCFVQMRTRFGGWRMLDWLNGEPRPESAGNRSRIMAIAHAASGDLIHAQPLGARLSEVQSHALLKAISWN